MLFRELVAVADDVAATAARNAKIDRLAALLTRLGPDEIPVAVAWLAGDLRQGRIGLGGAALAAATNATDRGAAPATAMPSLFDDVAGTDTAERDDSSRAAADPLTLLDVDATFEQLAKAGGRGVGSARARQLAALFARATGAERDFLVRLVHGELRQGALLGVMEEAVARTSGIPAREIRRAAMLAGDLEPVAVTALSEGRGGLARFRLDLFRPVLPMLAQPAESLEGAMKRMGEAALEAKLDGARIQVHRKGDRVAVYSRTLRDVTAAVPEVVEAVRGLPVADAIFDGE